MLMEFINAIQEYEFLRNALYTSVLVGIIAGAIGSFIVLKGMSLMGDAISHAVLPGVAISYMLNINYIIGASLFGLLSAVFIGYITQHSKLKNDTAIGIVFSSFLALGVILISKAKSSTDLNQILFGNVLAVSKGDMFITLIVGIMVLVFIFLFFKELKITTFDPITAQVSGMNVTFFHYAIIFLLTIVAVASLKTVGTILVIAMLITPAASAYLLVNKLSHMIALSSLIGAVCSIIGLFLSYTYNLASGASIVLVLSFVFILVFLFSPSKGIVFVKRRGLKNEKAI